MKKDSKLNFKTIKDLIFNKIFILIALLIQGSISIHAQSTATVAVNCSQTLGTLFRAEDYNNVSGKNTGSSTRNADYAFMNSNGLHAKVMRVWLGEADVYNPTTSLYNYSVITDYLNDVSSIYADEMLVNFTASMMIQSWKYTPAQCKPVVKKILLDLKNMYPKIKYIECMNEPDNWGGGFTESMVYPYYKVFYQAVNELNSENNYPVPLQIGGIAIMTFKYNYSWLLRFLDDYKSDTDPTKRLDFISYHMYSYKSGPREISTSRGVLDTWLLSRDLPTDIPALITETGLFAGDDTSGTVADDYLRQASGMASYTYWFTQNSKNVPFQWVLRHANYGIKDQMVSRPVSYSNKLTPYGNMLKMMGMMKKTKISTTNVMDGNGIGVYGYAALDSSGISVMAWNYQHTGTTRYNATFNINNLPAIFTGKNIRRRMYKIDQTTSNHNFDLANCNLAVLSDTILSNPGTSYTIKLPLMNENSVQMIILEPSDISTGISTIQNDQRVRISPNPTSGDHFNLELNGFELNESLTIEIFDISGKIVYSNHAQTGNNGFTSIPVFTNYRLKKGIYVVGIKSNNTRITTKLVIS